mmetsp:Transcript_31465/g.94466  ORF Transcript_31465/g.94466 Transcript_31465/m.94466 type:complete len:88 (+) Transcript_31465:139-402(+)
MAAPRRLPESAICSCSRRARQESSSRRARQDKRALQLSLQLSDQVQEQLRAGLPLSSWASALRARRRRRSEAVRARVQEELFFSVAD